MKTFKLFLYLMLLFIFSLFLVACVGADDAPARAIEIYYQALVEKDQPGMLNQSCAEWEATALLEFDSFISVDTELVEFKCQSTHEDGSLARVICEGAISASYEGEVREFSLADQTFIVLNEGGEWRMCGYD